MRWLLFFAFALAPASAAPPPKVEACLECHDTVDMAKFRRRSHGGLACTECHASITALPHADKLPAVACRRCHEHQVQDYLQSIHGQARTRGQEQAPTCGTCHGKVHDIITKRDKRSLVARQNMASTCGRCHDAAFLARLDMRIPSRTSRMGLTPDQVK